MPILVPVDPKQDLVLKIDPYLRRVFRLLRLTQAGAASAVGEAPSILYLCLWNIGDVVLSLPMLAALRSRFPQARITVLGRPHLRVLLAECPWVDEIVCADIPWSRREGKYRPRDYLFGALPRLLRQLRRRRFDIVLDGQVDFRSNLLMWLIGGGRRIGFGHHGGGYFLTDDLPIDFARPHTAQVFHQLAEHLGAPPDLPPLRMHLPAACVRRALARLTATGIAPEDFLLVIHPGAGHPVRRWGLENFAAVIRHLREIKDLSGLRVVGLADPDSYGCELQRQADVPVLQVDLEELIGLMSLCDLLLSADNGPMHIATAVGTPVIALLGPTDPSMWRPWGEGHEVIVLPDFPCRPCGDRCKFDQPYCVVRISPVTVSEVAERRVRALWPARGRRRAAAHV